MDIIYIIIPWGVLCCLLGLKIVQVLIIIKKYLRCKKHALIFVVYLDDHSNSVTWAYPS
jgi:hypothetical protein